MARLVMAILAPTLARQGEDHQALHTSQPFELYSNFDISYSWGSSGVLWDFLLVYSPGGISGKFPNIITVSAVPAQISVLEDGKKDMFWASSDSI